MTQDHTTIKPPNTGTASNRIQYLETTDAYNKWAKVISFHYISYVGVHLVD